MEASADECTERGTSSVGWANSVVPFVPWEGMTGGTDGEGVGRIYMAHDTLTPAVFWDSSGSSYRLQDHGRLRGRDHRSCKSSRELNHDWISPPPYTLVIIHLRNSHDERRKVCSYSDCMKSFGGYEKSWK